MKFFARHIKLFSILILFITFLLQGIWLYQTFQLSTKNYKEELQKELIQASIIETMKRSTELGNSLSKEERATPFEMPPDSLYKNKYFPLPIVNLEYLYSKNFLIQLKRIDSSLKKEKKISKNFVINRIRTKDNVVLESTAPETKAEWATALKTEGIPLRVDESEILVLYLLNPNWAIFHQMALIIFLSALIVFLVAIGLWWQYNNYIKEKELRQFQKDHTEAVIHNMATPLQTMKVATQALQDNKDLTKEKQEHFFEMQKRQISSLESQIKKILIVSRSDKSAITLNPKSVDIKEFVINICESFKSSRRKDIFFHNSFDLVSSTVFLDEQLFADVLKNLIENAVKYSKKTVNITIDCKRTKEEFIVKVMDDGLGIAPKYQKDIFDKFNRGASPFREGAKGFGIGLSFVKVIIEAHKGNITLFSEGENKGTTFTMHIPQ